MENAEIVLVPAPLMGHLVAEVELARQLVAQHPQISIAILIPKHPEPNANPDAYLRSLDAELALDGAQRISLVELPQLDNLPPDWISKPSMFQLVLLLTDLYKPIVKRVLEDRRRRTAAIVFDMFCTPMIDVAEELGVPSYMLFPSGASTLSLMFQLASLAVDVANVFDEMPPESTSVEVPGFRIPVPLMVWPRAYLRKGVSAQVICLTARYRKTKGILVNTFNDLEFDLLRSLSENERIPPVYSVGPILHLGRQIDDSNDRDPVLRWLDRQPVGSVVFLCFGSNGSFGKEQVEQIAAGIERSGHRFLWSLRRQPNPGKAAQLPTDYDDFAEVLPEGFLERKAEVGKVIGWAPQTAVLGHQAVGAFVSHCGWNSVLESLWFGVPLVAWPMYAEQQLNAFLLVRELGVAVELRLDYAYSLAEREGNMVVMAAEVEAAIRRVMDGKEGEVVRKKVKEMRDMARKALEVGGSSSKSIASFIEDMVKNNYC